MDISLKHAVSLMNNVFVSTFKINKNQNLEAVAFKPPGSLLQAKLPFFTLPITVRGY